MPPLVGVPMRRVWAAAALVLGIVGCSGRNQVRQVGGLLSIDPVAVDFGDVALGMEATVAVTLQNVGIVPMNVDHFAQFSSPAFEVHGLPVTLAPGDQAKLAVRYRPPALGEHQLSLELATDSPAEPRADVGLRGHAVRGLVPLWGDPFDFGNVVVNEVRSQTFSVSNTIDGHALTSVRIEPPVGGDSTAFAVKPPGDSPIQPAQSMLVTVEFKR